jgi:hypothetical protein
VGPEFPGPPLIPRIQRTVAIYGEVLAVSCMFITRLVISYSLTYTRIQVPVFRFVHNEYLTQRRNY